MNSKRTLVALAILLIAFACEESAHQPRQTDVPTINYNGKIYHLESAELPFSEESIVYETPESKLYLFDNDEHLLQFAENNFTEYAALLKHLSKSEAGESASGRTATWGDFDLQLWRYRSYEYPNEGPWNVNLDYSGTNTGEVANISSAMGPNGWPAASVSVNIPSTGGQIVVTVRLTKNTVNYVCYQRVKTFTASAWWDPTPYGGLSSCPAYSFWSNYIKWTLSR